MNKIIIIAGDPNSINTEIIYKTWKNLNKDIKKKIYIIGNYQLIRSQFKKLNYKQKVLFIKDINEKVNTNSLKVINIPLDFQKCFDVSLKNSTKYFLTSLNLAHKLAEQKKIIGFINCPIDKKLIKKTTKLGLTELLASKSNIKNGSEVMLIYNKKLSVAPITTHIKIKDISRKINKELIIKKIFTLNKAYFKLFKKKPKIGVLGLNPHNNEYSKNSEELRKIIPAISFLKKKKLKVVGPLIADTVFINDYKKYDVIVGMYHDQVLGPFKTLFHFNAINITLGLNYLRVSPDHGPAFNLIKKNKAKHESLLRCINFINSRK